jgi:hypothetical protein
MKLFTTLLYSTSLMALAVVNPALAQDQGSVRAIQAQAVKSTVQFETLRAATEALVNPILKCNSLQKFYAPTDPAKDADGCVGSSTTDNIQTGSAASSVPFAHSPAPALFSVTFPTAYTNIPKVQLVSDQTDNYWPCSNSYSTGTANGPKAVVVNVTRTGFTAKADPRHNGCGTNRVNTLTWFALPQ